MNKDELNVKDVEHETNNNINIYEEDLQKMADTELYLRLAEFDKENGTNLAVSFLKNNAKMNRNQDRRIRKPNFDTDNKVDPLEEIDKAIRGLEELNNNPNQRREDNTDNKKESENVLENSNSQDETEDRSSESKTNDSLDIRKIIERAERVAKMRSREFTLDKFEPVDMPTTQAEPKNTQVATEDQNVKPRDVIVDPEAEPIAEPKAKPREVIDYLDEELEEVINYLDAEAREAIIAKNAEAREASNHLDIKPREVIVDLDIGPTVESDKKPKQKQTKLDLEVDEDLMKRIKAAKEKEAQNNNDSNVKPREVIVDLDIGPAVEPDKKSKQTKLDLEVDEDLMKRIKAAKEKEAQNNNTSKPKTVDTQEPTISSNKDIALNDDLNKPNKYVNKDKNNDDDLNSKTNNNDIRDNKTNSKTKIVRTRKRQLDKVGKKDNKDGQKFTGNRKDKKKMKKLQENNKNNLKVTEPTINPPIMNIKDNDKPKAKARKRQLAKVSAKDNKDGQKFTGSRKDKKRAKKEQENKDIKKQEVKPKNMTSTKIPEEFEAISTEEQVKYKTITVFTGNIMSKIKWVQSKVNVVNAVKGIVQDKIKMPRKTLAIAGAVGCMVLAISIPTYNSLHNEDVKTKGYGYASQQGVVLDNGQIIIKNIQKTDTVEKEENVFTETKVANKASAETTNNINGVKERENNAKMEESIKTEENSEKEMKEDREENKTYIEGINVGDKVQIDNGTYFETPEGEGKHGSFENHQGTEKSVSKIGIATRDGYISVTDKEIRITTKDKVVILENKDYDVADLKNMYPDGKFSYHIVEEKGETKTTLGWLTEKSFEQTLEQEASHDMEER